MEQTFRHLGDFSDWVVDAAKLRPLYPAAAPGSETQARVRDVLGWSHVNESPQDVRIENTWERDGLEGEVVSWSVGYGPRTQAWVLKPAGATTALPGIVALHDHGGFKYYGKEKIADGPNAPETWIGDYRSRAYGDRAFANALAHEGFVVLIHDTFLWSSRRFPLETMPESIKAVAGPSQSWWQNPGLPPEVAHYNAVAGLHEHLIEKYCTLLGTTMAGVVNYEDRVAVNYLRSRSDVAPSSIGCVGLSGGGNRAALLQATCDDIAAAVIVGLMSTYEHLLDHNVVSHTWMFFPTGWARYGDWTDLAACRAPSPLLVQYDLDDDLFTVEGMQAADRRLAAHYASVGRPENYRGEFYPGPHQFSQPMQATAFDWLRQHLGADAI